MWVKKKQLKHHPTVSQLYWVTAEALLLVVRNRYLRPVFWKRILSLRPSRSSGIPERYTRILTLPTISERRTLPFALTSKFTDSITSRNTCVNKTSNKNLLMFKSSFYKEIFPRLQLYLFFSCKWAFSIYTKSKSRPYDVVSTNFKTEWKLHQLLMGT